MGFPRWEGQWLLDSSAVAANVTLMALSSPLQFDIPGIHCDACIASITKAVHRIDPAASVTADLATKRVIIGSKSDHEAHEFVTAIEDAGFDVNAAE
jgi:copper chaperone